MRHGRARRMVIAGIVVGMMAVAAPAIACGCLDARETWPASGAQIPTNPLLVISMNNYYSSGTIAEVYRPRLRSLDTGHVVELRVVFVASGPALVGAQVALRATRRLRARARYALELDDDGRHDFGEVVWKTTDSADRQPPQMPTVFLRGYFRAPTGKGTPWASEPVHGFSIETWAWDDGPKLARIELGEKDSQEPPSVRLVPVVDDAIELGIRNCGGLDLRAGPVYRATINLVDWAGNAAAETHTVEFGIPAEPTLAFVPEQRRADATDLLALAEPAEERSSRDRTWGAPWMGLPPMFAFVVLFGLVRAAKWRRRRLALANVASLGEPPAGPPRPDDRRHRRATDRPHRSR